MSYNFDRAKFLFFVTKWKRSTYIVTLVLLLTLCVGVLPSVLENNPKGAIFVFIVFCYVFWLLVIRIVSRESKLLNHIISIIEIDNSTVKLSTASFSAFFGMMNKKSINLEVATKDIQFELAKEKYPKNNKYLGVVYIIRVAATDYYLAEKLFDDFENLKMNLERVISS